MTVYADVLVALNTMLTYILIVASRVICKIPTNKWAVAVSSVVGGFSSLVIFYEDASVFFSVFYKITTGAVIVFLAFLPWKLKKFIKVFLSFFCVSFLFGGAMYAIEFTVNPGNIMYCNGTVYFDMSISYLVGCILSIYGVFVLADYLITKQNIKCGKCELEITYRNTTVKMTALVDTGNSLVDGMSGKPVIVAELKAASPLFSREEMLFFKTDSYENVPESLNKTIRLIPCKAITGETLLRAFVPSCVKIKTEKNAYTTSFCTVAVINSELSQGEYRALLNNIIFENVREEKKDDKIFT